MYCCLKRLISIVARLQKKWKKNHEKVSRLHSTSKQQKNLFFLFLKRGKKIREIDEKKISPQQRNKNKKRNTTYFSGTNICTFSLSICVPKQWKIRQKKMKIDRKYRHFFLHSLLTSAYAGFPWIFSNWTKKNFI